MSVRLRTIAIRSLGLLSATGVVLLTGCGSGTIAGPSSTAAFKIKGNVHGGAYPIQNATIRLMETASTGTWSTTSLSYTGTAKQLLTTTSDSYGNFSFPDTGWTCDGGQYAYITVTGGHTASTENDNVIQIGTIGGCSTDLASQSEIDNVNVYISELSTVAAAYALGNFISIDSSGSAGQQIVNITAPGANNDPKAGCTGSGTLSCTHAGLAHAFRNAYNLVDSVTYKSGQTPTGAARSTLPNNSQGTAPQALINTMGNILQSCVDSAGGTVATYSTYSPGGKKSTHCGDLFYYTTAPGTTTPPTDTLSAALNMSHYPTNNVDSLFNLQPRAVFFTPDMSSDLLSGSTSQLMAFSLSIFYTGTGLKGDAGMPYPVDLALDASDNVYVAYAGDATGASYGAVNEFGPDGTGVFFGAHQTTIGNPASIAVDQNGLAWLSNDVSTGGNVFQIYTPGSGGTYGAIGTTLTVPRGYAAGVATDMSNNVWVSRDASSAQSIYRFNASNSYAVDTFGTTPKVGSPTKRLFVDYRQNVLGVTSDTSNLGKSNSTTAASVWLFPYGSNGTTSALTSVALNAKNGYGITMSNSDTSYVPVYEELDTETGYTNGTMSENGAGSYTAASGTGSTYGVPMGAGIDGSGNLFWPDFETSGQLFWMQPSSTTSVSAGTLTSVYPCYPVNGACYSGASSYLRGMAIDSSGAVWYVADSSTGVLVQTLGLASPSYPLQEAAEGAVIIAGSAKN